MANREINEHGPSNVIRWTPALVPPNIDMITVHALCAPPCAAQQMLIPHPGRVRRWLEMGQNRQATAGLFLPLWWDRRLQVPQGDAYEEDDQHALLQTPSGEKDWYANCKLLDNWYEATTLSTPQHLEREGEAQEDLAPILIIDEWEPLMELLAEPQESPAELTLIMHGLFQTDVGQRETRVERDIEDIRAAVLRTWEDYFHTGITGFLHIVKPQDETGRNRLRTIVEMSGAGVTLPVRDVATLRRVHWQEERGSDYLQGAAYHTPGINNCELFAQTDLAHWCLSHHSYRCNVHIENQILLPLSPANLRQGSRIDIFVHQQEYPEQDEVASLMQQAAPSQSPSLRQIRLHGLHCHLATILIDSDQPLMEAVAESWPYGQRSYDTVIALHPVEQPPAFQSGQDPMYLVEHQEDYFEQVHTDDILALITISFESQSQKKQKIRTLWCPHKATRIDMLHFLRSVWYCRRPNLICFVYWNGSLWPENDNALRTLVAGDHIRLVIRSDGPEWCDIEFSEGTSRSYRVYESSSEPEAQAASANPPPSERSRSRGSRIEEQSDSESHSLLQRSSHMISRQVHPESGDPVVLQPHVSDRWCAVPPLNYPSPRHFTLADKIDTTNHFVHIKCTEATQVWHQLTTLDRPPFLDRTCVTEWHPATRDEWLHLLDWHGETPTGWRFYMDGSSSFDVESGQRKGAAVTVLVVDTTDGERFGGIQGRVVPPPATSPLTESWAVLQALLWATSLVNQHGDVGPIDLFGDATGPGHFMQGEWTPQAHRSIVDACRGFRNGHGHIVNGTTLLPMQDIPGTKLRTQLPKPLLTVQSWPQIVRICGMKFHITTLDRKPGVGFGFWNAHGTTRTIP